MRRPQVSIAGLALVIFVLAIGMAAIRSGSPAWSGAMFSLMAFAMISSLLGVALARGPRRVFWVGFATLGWSYLVLVYVPWLYEHVGQFLLAMNLFQALSEVLHPEEQTVSVTMGGFRSVMAYGGGASPAVRVADLSPFQKIGLALEVLLWAYLGGWVARYFASDANPVASSPATVGASPARPDEPPAPPSGQG